jgi:flagellum-specific peptidoglycan hydrolase FlgJ
MQRLLIAICGIGIATFIIKYLTNGKETSQQRNRQTAQDNSRGQTDLQRSSIQKMDHLRKGSLEESIMPTRQAFIIKVAGDAVPACVNTGIWPSVVISQAIQESDSGTSKLAAFNNIFGHMASATWFGQTVQLVTGGKLWRSYASMIDAIKAHINILHHPKYIAAGVISAKTPFSQAAALQKAGYDAGPDRAQYAGILAGIIKQYNLQQYDDAMEAIERKKNASGLAFHQLPVASQLIKIV